MFQLLDHWCACDCVASDSDCLIFVQDLVRVPVNRDNCSATPGYVTPNTTVSQPEVPEFMDITLKLSYAGRSASQVFLSETLQDSSGHEFFYRYIWNPNVGDYQRSVNTDVLEMITGTIYDLLQVLVADRVCFKVWYTIVKLPRTRILGKTHLLSFAVRNRFLCGGLRLIMEMHSILINGVIWLLDLHYWFTCTSTAGISIPGNVMISLASLMDTAFSFVAVAQQMDPRRFVSWTWLILKNVLSQVIKPILVLKVVLRLNFGLGKMVKCLPSSFLERRSGRVEVVTPFRSLYLHDNNGWQIFILLVFGYWILTPEERSSLPHLVQLQQNCRDSDTILECSSALSAGQA